MIGECLWIVADMIADWRTRFASPDSWFLIVQLPVLGGTPTVNPESTGAAEIRAVQWDVGHAVANADGAVITDLGDPHDIHPENKQDRSVNAGLNGDLWTTLR